MAGSEVYFHRRRFMQSVVGAGAVLAAPQIIPSTALGKDGEVAPSERIVLGGIGIGGRGSYDLGCFLQEPDVRCVAICDVRAAPPGRQANGRHHVREPGLRHLS